MKKNYSFLVFVFTLFTISFYQLSAQDCADEGNIYVYVLNGKKYEIVKELKNWDAAASCALERGGYLAEINSREENDSLFEAVLNNAAVADNYKSVLDGGGSTYIWIGATDKETEGNWLWDGDNDDSGISFWIGEGQAGKGGGSAVGGKFTNWGGTSKGTPNEPDDYAGTQDGGAMALRGWPSGTTLYGSKGEWNDIDVSNTIYYIIEYDSSTSGMGQINNPKCRIYPNPANGYFLVSSDETIQSVRVYNLFGSLLIQEDNVNQAEKRIDLSSFPAGAYLVKIQSANLNMREVIFIR
ncbi:T9SS type A sorting domain-containing protein [Bacteroidota bacterium]